MNDWIAGKEKNEMTLVVANREIVVDNSKLVRTMDTGADAYLCVMPWEPGKDYELDKITHHNKFSDCGVYIAGELVMTGTLYGVKQSRDKTGSSKDLRIYTQTADIIDSNMIAPYEARNISLVDRCKQLCGPFGIPVVVGNGVDLTTTKKVYKKAIIVRDFIDALFESEEPPDQLNQDNQDTFLRYKWVYAGTKREIQKFSRVAAKQTDKIFTHLRKLAASMGLLLSCTKYGDLIITQANITGIPVGTIEEDTSLSEVYEADYDGRKRFGIYRAITSSSRSSRPSAIKSATDDAIKKPRVLTFRSDNNLPGEGTNAAEWQKNKIAAASMTFDFPVNSWYAPDEKIWEPNTIVTVKSDILEAPDGFNFLISRVAYNNSDKGAAAILGLKPPSVYSMGAITEP